MILIHGWLEGTLIRTIPHRLDNGVTLHVVDIHGHDWWLTEDEVSR